MGVGNYYYYYYYVAFAREALGRPRGGEGRGHIVSPQAQLVITNELIRVTLSQKTVAGALN